MLILADVGIDPGQPEILPVHNTLPAPNAWEFPALELLSDRAGRAYTRHRTTPGGGLCERPSFGLSAAT